MPPVDPSIISADRRIVVVQRNPKSGSGAGRNELLQLVRSLRSSNFHTRMFKNRLQLDAFIARPSIAKQLRCIVAAGGDGTVADVLNRHPNAPIAVLPLGTENLLAKYLNLPRCGRTLARVITAGRFRILDSALANGHRFLLMLSAGVDGQIVHAIHQSRTGTIRRMGYILPTLRAFLSSRPQKIRALTLDGRFLSEGTHVIVTNIPKYGFGLAFAPEAVPDDGLLNIRVYHGSTRWQIFWHALRLKCKLPVRDTECTRFVSASFRIETAEEGAFIGVQSDGDPCDGLPVQIDIQSGSLCVLVR